PSPSTDQLARLDGDLLYRRVKIFSVNPFSWPHDASIVGASPCEAVPVSIPSAVKSTPIAGRQQLVDYLAAGEKPREAWRIGTEHEKFGFRTDDLRAPPFEGERGIRALLEGEFASGGSALGGRRHGPRFPRHGLPAEVAARRDAVDAQGPLQDHARI